MVKIERAKMVKTKQTILAQLIARAVIFLLFLVAVFVVVPVLRYLLILFIITNLIFGFINGKKDLPVNIAFIILTPLLFIPVLEYLITIILMALIGIHLVMFWLWYKGGGKEKEKKEKSDDGKIQKSKEKKGFVWYALRASFCAMLVLLPVNIIYLGFIPLILAFVILVFFTFVVSIIHLVKYEKKAFAIVSLIISSILILLMIVSLGGMSIGTGVSPVGIAPR